LLWLCWIYRLNFAALQLVATLFLPNGSIALFAAISRDRAIPKSSSLETGRFLLLCDTSPLPEKQDHQKAVRFSPFWTGYPLGITAQS
jgi:hypothetical protein